MLPEFLTSRLRLRPIDRNDGSRLLQLSSNPKVMKHINGGKTLSEKEIEVDLQNRLGALTDLFGYWMIESLEEEEFIGWVALKKLEKTEKIEVGYRLLEEHWGKGYAFEAASELLKYAFLRLHLKEVVAVTLEENVRSLRVLEKLGMKYKKKARFYGFNCCYYELKRTDYL
jgi:ribosomal-protein-alanine N-acetyltransferase